MTPSRTDTSGRGGICHLSAARTASTNGFGTITVKVGATATLQARLLVTVPLTITCTLPVGSTVNSDLARLNVQEAVSRSITAGSGSPNPDGSFACDGATYAYMVQVQSSTVPWHGGQAVVNAGVGACGFLADSSFQCTSVETGSLIIRIR